MAKQCVGKESKNLRHEVVGGEGGDLETVLLVLLVHGLQLLVVGLGQGVLARHVHHQQHFAPEGGAYVRSHQTKYYYGSN